MKRKQRSIFWQPSRVWSGNLKEWKWDGCDWLLLWKPTFPPSSSSSPSSCPHDVVPPQLPVSPPPRYVCWQNVDETAQMIATIQSPKAHNTGINISWMRWKIHFKKERRGWGIFFLALTAVGNSETVRHFQIVNVRRQSEFRGAKLNHSYPKRAVLLIRAPRKKSPWKPTQNISHNSHTIIFTHRFYASSRLDLPIWTLGEPPSAHPHKTSSTETDKFTIFSMSTV